MKRALALALAAAPVVSSAQSPCLDFANTRLLDIARRPDRTLVAFSAAAENRCNRPVDVEATFVLNDPEGAPLAERRVALRAIAFERLEVAGTFEVAPPARAERIGGTTVVFVER